MMSWKNTREALKHFAHALRCMKCESEPTLITRCSICGHIFCKECISIECRCTKCDNPIHPTEVVQDGMITGLVHACNKVASIVSEDHLWDTEENISRGVEGLPAPVAPSMLPEKHVQKTKRLTLSGHSIKKINKVNAKGETPLHVACLEKDEVSVKSLLAAGANPNSKDHAHWTPLQEVVNFGYTNICRLLLEGGALPNIPGSENRTALHEAALQDKLEEAKMLIEYKANVNVFDRYGKTPSDYCASAEMREILKAAMDESEILENTIVPSQTSELPFLALKSKIVVYGAKLNKKNQELLSKMAVKHKIEVVQHFAPSVTHLVLETNGHITVNSSYDTMLAILRGCWILHSEWLALSMELDDITNFDPELFELAAAPVEGIPKKSRENAQEMKPGLFSNCKFYFAMQSQVTYCVGELKFTKENLVKLIAEGGGTVLTREPDPAAIEDNDNSVLFHLAGNPAHPLYKCKHYVIYAPGKDEPRRIYKKPYIMSLPLLWLTESIERFTLLDPSHLGIWH